MAKKYTEDESKVKKDENSKASKDYDILKKHLSQSFKTPVQFTCNDKGKGKITFPFKNEEELERLIIIFDKLK